MSDTFSPSGGLFRHRTGTQSHWLKQKWATESVVMASWGPGWRAVQQEPPRTEARPQPLLSGAAGLFPASLSVNAFSAVGRRCPLPRAPGGRSCLGPPGPWAGLHE